MSRLLKADTTRIVVSMVRTAIATLTIGAVIAAVFAFIYLIAVGL